jgi:hypothetical protein
VGSRVVAPASRSHPGAIERGLEPHSVTARAGSATLYAVAGALRGATSTLGRGATSSPRLLREIGDGFRGSWRSPRRTRPGSPRRPRALAEGGEGGSGQPLVASPPPGGDSALGPVARGSLAGSGEGRSREIGVAPGRVVNSSSPRPRRGRGGSSSAGLPACFRRVRALAQGPRDVRAERSGAARSTSATSGREQNEKPGIYWKVRAAYAERPPFTACSARSSARGWGPGVRERKTGDSLESHSSTP